jgi:predicted extracellular nuclease
MVKWGTAGKRGTVLSLALATVLAGVAWAAGAVPAAAADPLPIAAIQGTSSATPYRGQQVTTTPSVVTAVYGQGSTAELRGFVIQTPGTGGAKDLDSGSDAVFVYAGTQAFDVQLGDQVIVTGVADEFDGLTEITRPQIAEVPGPLPAVAPVTGLRWTQTASRRENLESMLFSSSERFTVADTYPLLPFGELALSGGELPVQPTDVGAPGSARAEAQEARNAALRVNLDDGSNRGFTRTAALPPRPLPFLTDGRSVKVGDTVTLDEPVIVDYRNRIWKFNPTTPVVAGAEIATVHPSRADRRPRVGGAFSVASFNVLNYFTTTGEGRSGCRGSNLDATLSPSVTFDCDVRGAWDAADLARQQAKITAAITRLDASVVGLMEIENSAKLGEPADEATASLVAALNAAAGSRRWAYVRSSPQLQGVADQDFITNALIYQPRKVRLVSPAYALGAQAGPGQAFDNARTPIAAAFAPRGGGSRMLVSVNHFKSKSGGSGATGDNADVGDGQGAFNGDRVRQARALLSWLPQVQTATRSQATALVGDFNAYSREDPLRVLADGGYRNAAPSNQYSYVFSGLSGSLDHILLDRPARRRLTQADVWNINSGQSQALEYSTYQTTAVDFYRPGPLRSSDHDPVVAGFRRR